MLSGNCGLAVIVLETNKNIFKLPFINHSVTYYGVLFAVGIILSLFFVRKMIFASIKKEFLSNKVVIENKIEVIAINGIIFGIIGARLGHVFLYGFEYYKEHLIDIFKIWEGGLASHGGIVGLLLGIAISHERVKIAKYGISKLFIADFLAFAMCFVGGFIRVGNFINQEITGIPVVSGNMGVVFQNSADGINNVPCHPVQLYEAALYFMIAGIVSFIHSNNKHILGKGVLFGIGCFIAGVGRFFIEYYKNSQSCFDTFLGEFNMGQILTIPLIVIGIFFMLRFFSKKNSKFLF